MKIQFKNLFGTLSYLPQLQLYTAEFIIGQRNFSFSGENKLELYRHIAVQLEPYVIYDLNLDEATGKAMTLPCETPEPEERMDLCFDF